MALYTALPWRTTIKICILVLSLKSPYTFRNLGHIIRQSLLNFSSACVLSPWDNVMGTAAWYVKTQIKNISVKIRLWIDVAATYLGQGIGNILLCFHECIHLYNLLDFTPIHIMLLSIFLLANANCTPNVERSMILSD